MEGWATGVWKDFRSFDLEAYRHSQERGKWDQTNTIIGALGVT